MFKSVYIVKMSRAKKEWQAGFAYEQPLVQSELGEILYPYQITAVTNNVLSLKKRGVSVSGDVPGAGKTYISLGCAKYLDLSVFVISTKSGITNFIELLDNMGINCIGMANYELIKKGKYYKTAEDYLAKRKSQCPLINITYKNTVNKFNNSVTGKTINTITWDIPDNTLIIIDEVHKAKNGVNRVNSSITSTLITSIKHYINLPKKVYITMLSASITDRNDCSDTLLYMLGLLQECSTVAYNALIKKLPQQDAMGALRCLLFPYMGSNTTHEDLAGFYNTNTIKVFPVKMSTEHHEKIEEYSQQLLALEESEKLNLGNLVKLWREIEFIKVQYIVNNVIQDVQNNNSVIVFTNFTNSLEYLQQHISKYIPVGILSGYVPEKQRTETVTAFQSNVLKCIIVNNKIGGTSINFHDVIGNSPRITYITPTMSGIDFYQVLGRANRAMAKSPIVQNIVTSISDGSRLSWDNRITELMLSGINRIHEIHGNNKLDIQSNYGDE